MEKGDRVGIWSPNCAEWTIVQFATARVGAILITINPNYRPDEFAYAVNQSGLSLVFAATSLKDSQYRQMVSEAAAQCETLERTIYLDTKDWTRLSGAGLEVPTYALASRASDLLPGDAINIQYTSGTTGHPKGATLSHQNILNSGSSSPSCSGRGPSV